MWGPIELFVALIAAAATAVLFELFAHDAMGMPIDVIRLDALGAAGLIFAARRVPVMAEKVTWGICGQGPPIKSRGIRSVNEQRAMGRSLIEAALHHDPGPARRIWGKG